MGRGSIATAIGIISMAATIALPAAAESSTYYRWKDERGNLVISDRPPENPRIAYETVQPGVSLRRWPTPAPTAPPEPGKSGSEPGKTGSETEPVAQEAPVPSKPPQADPELCARARANLETLGSAARIRMRDEDGEMRFLDDEEREAQRQEALKAIEAHCGD